MKYIFWQNIISIHQSEFIKILSEKYSVTLIVENTLDQYRIDDGWNVPFLGQANLIEKPNKNTINQILNNSKEDIHIFSGIDAFPNIHYAFTIAIELNLKIGVQLEIFEYKGLKGILRKLKYFLLQQKYGSKIDFVLAMGSKACLAYKKVGFENHKVYNWAYFTEKTIANVDYDNASTLPRLIYVGRLDINKNILKVLPIINKHISRIESFNIIGDGILKNKVLSFVNDKIKYFGSLSNKDVHTKMSHADILILPSLYDGWGAVVNEALMVGTRVLCSEECGANDLISENRGIVFSNKNNDFEERLLEILQNGPVSMYLRKSISDWAEENISGEASVSYFLRIIDSVYDNEKRPVAPWKKK